MEFHLVCVHPWGPYKRGDRIEEPSEVARVNSQREKHFVRVPCPPKAMKAQAPREVEVDGVEYERK